MPKTKTEIKKEIKKTKEAKKPKGANPVRKRGVLKPTNGAKKKEITSLKPKPARYYEAIGRRKTALARIRLWTKGQKGLLINEKPYQEYFPTLELQEIASSSLKRMKCFEKFRVLAKVRGGGLSAQAEAVRHGTARVLTLFNSDFQKRLRKVGYLTRDSRMRERKKFGLKRARRAPQWQKR